MLISIAAVDEDFGIGKDNKLLAHIKPDLQYYKNTTNGQVIVMGYNTYHSLPKRPLPNRINIVLTTKQISIDGAMVVHSLQELLKAIEPFQASGKNIFICGGASLYKQMMPYVEKLYITHIFRKLNADTFFPTISEDVWALERAWFTQENLKHHCPHIFSIYRRKKPIFR